MKLHQILTEVPNPEERKKIKQTKWSGSTEIEKWLRKQKFKQIGKGAYSVAYARSSSDKVIKLSLESDYCWLKFAKIVKNTRSRHLPRIYDLIKYKDEYGEKMFIVIMEKLKPIKFSEIKWTGYNKGILAWLIQEQVIILETTSIRKQIRNIFNFETNIGWEEFGNKLKNLAKRFEQSNKSFANMYRQLKRRIGTKCWMDIHDGNVFYRESTNSFVFLDPYAGAN